MGLRGLGGSDNSLFGQGGGSLADSVGLSPLDDGNGLPKGRTTPTGAPSKDYSAPTYATPPQEQATQAPVNATQTPVLANGLIPANAVAPGTPNAATQAAGTALGFTIPTGYTWGMSNEMVYKNLDDAYTRYLGRPGSQEEYDRWAQDGESLATVLQAIMTSPEAQAYKHTAWVPQLQNAYQQYLGRGASEEELAGWLNQSDLGAALSAIMGSEEAKLYAARPAPVQEAAPSTTQNPPPVTPTVVAPTTTTVTPTVYPQHGWWDDQTVDPYANIGGGTFVNGGWIPASMAAEQGLTGTGVTNGGYSDNGGPKPTSPNPNAIQQGIWESVARMLTNPYSMSDEQVAMLKEQQKETLLSTLQQGLDQSGQAAASRGMANSGWLGANQLNQRDVFASDLTKSYRDIALQKQVQDYKDRIAAMTAADAALSNWTGRETDRAKVDIARQQIADEMSRFNQSLPINWFTAISGRDLGLTNAGIDATKTNNQANQWFWDWFQKNYGG